MTYVRNFRWLCNLGAYLCLGLLKALENRLLFSNWMHRLEYFETINFLFLFPFKFFVFRDFLLYFLLDLLNHAVFSLIWIILRRVWGYCFLLQRVKKFIGWLFSVARIKSCKNLVLLVFCKHRRWSARCLLEPFVAFICRRNLEEVPALLWTARTKNQLRVLWRWVEKVSII